MKRTATLLLTTKAIADDADLDSVRDDIIELQASKEMNEEMH